MSVTQDYEALFEKTSKLLDEKVKENQNLKTENNKRNLIFRI